MTPAPVREAERDAVHQLDGLRYGYLMVLVAIGDRAAFLSWSKGSAAYVSLGAPTREVRYFNDLDEAARCAAAEVGR